MPGVPSLTGICPPTHPPHRVRVIGSSTLALCYLASGAADAYYQFGLHCWDLAAATVIIREAGGIVIDTSGELYSLGLPSPRCTQRQTPKQVTLNNVPKIRTTLDSSTSSEFCRWRPHQGAWQAVAIHGGPWFCPSDTWLVTETATFHTHHHPHFPVASATILWVRQSRHFPTISAQSPEPGQPSAQQELSCSSAFVPPSPRHWSFFIEHT